VTNDPDQSLAARARRYDVDHARRLRAVAYRMLGSRADAEDIVQEAWLRWAEVDESTVENAEAFLSRLVTNLCLDKLRSASARREHYVGVWLPEPLLEDDQLFDWTPGPEKQVEFAQDVSVAFLLALERLSPLERAAFLLHDVFDLDYDEVARHLERSEAACRQLSSRARKNIKADYARREVAQEERDSLVNAFMDAVRSRDVTALVQVLTADAVLLADGGGKVSALPRPLHGNEVIARTFIGFAKMPAHHGWRLVATTVNGLPGCLIFDDLADGRLVETIALAPAPHEPGRVAAMYVQRNPDKLLAIAKRLQS
jgi:RNA polymerase sigma-70 factor, ECF subfamily